MATNSNQPPNSGKQSSSPFNPAHYPPGRLPALSSDSLEVITQKVGQGQLPTAQEIDAALSERQRALDKIEWMNGTDRPDIKERISSATATLRTTLTLDPLAAQGRDYRAQQKEFATRPRPRKDPLNAVILKILRGDLEAPARDVWTAVLGYEDLDYDLTVVEEGDSLRYWVDGENARRITFETFEARVSRLRKKLRSSIRR